jgi:hypothetical protein
MSDVARMFLEYSSVERFTSRLGFTPDTWQLDLLKSTAKRIIEVCGRQIGKSTITGLKAYRYAKTHPGALVLLISLSHRQSLLLFGKVGEALRSDPDHEAIVEKVNLQELVLRNGSRIIAAPGKDETIRGFSGVDLLVIDEAAYVPDKLYDAVAPMIAASQGQVILLSSPAGKDGFFWRIWDQAEGWERYRIKAEDCERIPKEFLEEQRQLIPDHVYRREYEAEFTEGLFSLVSYEDLQASMQNAVKSLGTYEMAPEESNLPRVEALSG